MQNITLTSDIECGPGKPLVWIIGPCVIEPGNVTVNIAQRLSEFSTEYRIPFIFKASFDKANRSSIDSYRGPGAEDGLETLQDIKRHFKIPVTTDVHEIWQVGVAAMFCDIIQIPALLSRQTDLLWAAGRTKLPVNVKKGQFMAPWDVKNIVKKLNKAGSDKVLLTERGTSFGYNNLVCDMRTIPTMQEYGYPVIFDATHSVQRPAAAGDKSDGDREMIPYLTRAAVAAGCDGLFLEAHSRPDEALSDGPNMLQLDDLPELIEDCLDIRNIITRRYRQTQ